MDSLTRFVSIDGYHDVLCDSTYSFDSPDDLVAASTAQTYGLICKSSTTNIRNELVLECEGSSVLADLDLVLEGATLDDVLNVRTSIKDNPYLDAWEGPRVAAQIRTAMALSDRLIDETDARVIIPLTLCPFSGAYPLQLLKNEQITITVETKKACSVEIWGYRGECPEDPDLELRWITYSNADNTIGPVSLKKGENVYDITANHPCVLMYVIGASDAASFRLELDDKTFAEWSGPQLNRWKRIKELNAKTDSRIIWFDDDGFCGSAPNTSINMARFKKVRLVITSDSDRTEEVQIVCACARVFSIKNQQLKDCYDV
jgi:hypothetical protein